MRVETVVYLALGSNIGNRREILKQARDLISKQVGAVLVCSEEHETMPEGFESEYPFINQVIKVSTTLSAQELLQVTQQIEIQLGRDRKSDGDQHFDRTCDIDIIMYGDLIIEEDNLRIPHPRFRERAFVLGPMNEIAGNVIDPVTRNSIMELMGKLNG